LATGEQIQLLRSANQANKGYARKIMAQLKAGESVRPEDQQFIDEFLDAEEERLQAKDLIVASKTRSLSREEDSFLKKFETKMIGGEEIQTVDPRTRVPRIERTRRQTSPDLEDIFKKANLPEGIKSELSSGLAELAPIADIDLENGETVLYKYLKQKLGPANVLASKDKERFFIRAGEGQSFQPLPPVNLLPSLARGARTFIAGLTGDAVGSLGGLPGAAIGGGLGSALGEGINVNNAIEFAKGQGIVTGEEPALIGKRNKDAAFAGALGGLFGGGAGTLKGIGRGVKTAIDEGAPLGKSISQGIRAESNTLAQGAANSSRALGLRGKEFRAAKGEIEQQGRTDFLKQKFGSLSDGPVAGDTAQQAIQRRLAVLNAERQVLFTEAEENFAKNLEKGNFGFIDMTNSYQKFVKEIKKASAESPAVADFVRSNNILGDLQSVLNSTKQQVLRGEVPASDLTRSRFVKKVLKTNKVESRMLDASGRPAVRDVQEEILEGAGFNPTQTTAADLRNTSNFISEKLDQFDGSQIAAPKRLKRLMVQFKGGLDSAFNPGIRGSKNSELYDAAISYLDDDDDILAAISGQNPFFGTIKTPKRAEEIRKFTRAFEYSKQIHKEIPSDLRTNIIGKSIKKGLDPSEAEDSLFNLSSESAAKLKAIIDKDPALKDTFELAVERRVYQSAPKQSQRLTNTSLESFEQASLASEQEILEAQTKGIKPTANPIDKALIPIQERARELESGFAGATVKTNIEKSRTVKALLGPDRTGKVLKESSRLGASQAEAKALENAGNTGAGGALGAVLGAGAGNSITGEPLGVGVGLLAGRQLGEVAEKQLSKSVGPALRFTADALETARTIPLAPLKDIASPFLQPSRDLEEDEIPAKFKQRKPGAIPSNPVSSLLFGGR